MTELPQTRASAVEAEEVSIRIRGRAGFTVECD